MADLHSSGNRIEIDFRLEVKRKFKVIWLSRCFYEIELKTKNYLSYWPKTQVLKFQKVSLRVGWGQVTFEFFSQSLKSGFLGLKIEIFIFEGIALKSWSSTSGLQKVILLKFQKFLFKLTDLHSLPVFYWWIPSGKSLVTWPWPNWSLSPGNEKDLPLRWLKVILCKIHEVSLHIDWEKAIFNFFEKNFRLGTQLLKFKRKNGHRSWSEWSYSKSLICANLACFELRVLDIKPAAFFRTRNDWSKLKHWHFRVFKNQP